MKKSRIYTKTGDAGETGLVSGTRISKSDPRIDLYGELDDFNSRLGFATSFIEKENSLKATVDFLHHIQSAVFDLGSNLACEAGRRAEYKLPQIPESFIQEIEHEIDRLDSELTPLKNFILPGGSTAAAAFHIARTGARNVERMIIGYHKATKEDLPVHAVIFLNRTSDYLFVLARYMNKVQDGSERNWIPRK